MKLKKTVILLIFILIVSRDIYSTGNEFVFTFVKYSGFDSGIEKMAVNSYSSIYDFISRTTNIRISALPRLIDLADPEIFRAPFLYFSGRTGFSLSEKEKDDIKKYLQGGGLLVLDDLSGNLNSGFDRSIRSIFKEILPYNKFSKLEFKVPIYRSFYLIKKVTGLFEVANYLEGIYINGRLSVIYSGNNLLGLWEKNEMSAWKNLPVPGGEAQRFEGIKLMVNIIMYSVTGTYKLDQVHEPYIEQKLKR